MGIKFIMLLFITFCTSLCTELKSQRLDPEKSRKFNDIISSEKIHTDFSKTVGDDLLQFAQTSYEKAVCYQIKAEASYSRGDYLDAVEKSRKSKQLIGNSDSIQQRLIIQNTLIMSYRRAGLIVESDDEWEVFEKLTNKLTPENKELNLLYTKGKILDIDKKYCEASQIKEKYIKLNDHNFANDIVGIRNRFAILVQLAYSEIKCGKILKAKGNLQNAKLLLKNIKSSEPILLKEFFYMDLGLISKYEQDNITSKKYFDSAYTLSQQKANKGITKLILEERIDANLDTVEDQLDFSKIVQKIREEESSTTKVLTSSETNYRKNEIAKNNSISKIYFWTFVILLIASGALITYQIRNSKKLKKRYQNIINSIENNSEIEYDNESSQTYSYEKDIIKNRETESKIFEKLLIFESKKQFTIKGISLAQMAVMLKTNTKYLTYVLKKYRNADFPKYINTCRINYIVKELHHNPQLLHYKISVIAELCGYSSHSQFATMFKSIEGMSPSQYIAFLEKDIEID